MEQSGTAGWVIAPSGGSSIAKTSLHTHGGSQALSVTAAGKYKEANSVLPNLLPAYPGMPVPVTEVWQWHSGDSGGQCGVCATWHAADGSIIDYRPFRTSVSPRAGWMRIVEDGTGSSNSSFATAPAGTAYVGIDFWSNPGDDTVGGNPMFADDAIVHMPETLKWDLRAEANANAETFKWDLFAAVNSNTSTYLWDLYAQIASNTETFKWDIFNPVNGNTETFLWD